MPTLLIRCLTFSMLWATCRHVTSYLCVLWATYVATLRHYCLRYGRHISYKCVRSLCTIPVPRKVSVWITEVYFIESQCNCSWHQKSKREQRLYMQVSARWIKFLWSLYDVSFCKIRPFYCQFGHRYDQACIWDGIVYHFTSLKKLRWNRKVLITKIQHVKWYRCTPQWLI